MKLDYETLQFERQLKRAKRLSLLDFTANVRQRCRQDCKASSSAVRKTVSHAASLVRRSKKSAFHGVVNKARKKIKHATPEAVTNLKQSKIRKIVRRHRLCPKAKRRRNAVCHPQIKETRVPHPVESHQFIDLEACSELLQVDIDAKMEIVASPGKNHPSSGVSVKRETGSSGVIRDKELPQPSFRRVSNYTAPPIQGHRADGYYRYIEKTQEELDEEVEYDMDEEDFAWLKLLNEDRCRISKLNKAQPLSPDTFERLMDRFEKEAHLLGSDLACATQQVSMLSMTPAPNDEDAVCNICGDDECTNTNVILFCDSCNLAVHQECYGVPYVPEGQWLCRRCQAGIGADVACCLCPVLGGAVKRTNDGRWAHVVCALWIPEVGFGSIELLEPITKLDQVPPARRKLTCAICSRSNIGASVQCMRKHCYKAFHISCAQQVGLYMKIEPVFDAKGNMINVSKTLLCDNHKPAGVRPFQPMIDNGADDDGRPPAPEKIKKQHAPTMPSQAPHSRGRKGTRVADFKKSKERCGTPVRDIPVIPPKRLTSIADTLSMRDKNNVMVKLLAYWTLKRRARNGVPLLRRLQVGSMPGSTVSKAHDGGDGSGALTDVMCVKRLRQQMEKVRLLLELIRKRERSKRDLIKAHETMLKLQLEPFAVHLRCILDELQSFDTMGIFADPVSPKEAPDYAVEIKNPMDFSEIRRKVDKHVYRSFDEFEDDFWLIVTNCKAYNKDGSLYYNLATQLGAQAKEVLETARESVRNAGYCPWTGLLYPQEELEARNSFSVFSSPSKIQSRRRSEHVGKVRCNGMLEIARRHSIADLTEVDTVMHCALTHRANKIEECVRESKPRAGVVKYHPRTASSTSTGNEDIAKDRRRRTVSSTSTGDESIVVKSRRRTTSPTTAADESTIKKARRRTMSTTSAADESTSKSHNRTSSTSTFDEGAVKGRRCRTISSSSAFDECTGKGRLRTTSSTSITDEDAVKTLRHTASKSSKASEHAFKGGHQHTGSMAIAVHDGLKSNKQHEREHIIRKVGKHEKVLNTDNGNLNSQQIVRKKRRRRGKSAYPFPEKVKKVKRALVAGDVKVPKKINDQQHEVKESEPSLKKPDAKLDHESSSAEKEAYTEDKCRRRTRHVQQLCHEDINDNLLLGLVPPKKRRSRMDVLSSKASEEDEPPQLSRCPSPTPVESSPEASSKARRHLVKDIVRSIDPPMLVMSQSGSANVDNIGNLGSLRRGSHPGTSPDDACGKKSLLGGLSIEQTFPRDVAEGVDVAGGKQTSPTPEKGVAKRGSSCGKISFTSGASGIASHEDTLDSVVSTESQGCPANGRVGLFNKFLSMATAVDCDSSYGSTYGHGGAVTSDSDTTSSSPDRADSEGASRSPVDKQLSDNLDSKSVVCIPDDGVELTLDSDCLVQM